MTTPSADQPSLTDDVHPPCRHGVDRAYFTCPVCDEAEGYVAKPFDDTADGLRAEGWQVELVRPADAPERWYESHDNLVIVTAYMASHGASAEDVADCVEKPWKFTEEFLAALAENEAS